MFIQPEFQRILSDYRKFEGFRVYALYDALGNGVSRRVKTRMVSEIFKIKLSKAQRAIVWQLEKRHLQHAQMAKAA